MAADHLVHAGAEDRVQEGSGTIIRVGDKTLAFFKVEGVCYALSNACPHKGGPLGSGTLSGHVVTCPWHGWTWDVRTGGNVRVPSLKPVQCFPVTAVAGQLYVEFPESTEAERPAEPRRNEG